MKKTILIVALLLSSSAALSQVGQPGDVRKYPYMNMVSAANPLAWKVTKASWSQADEDEYGAFVTRIGLAVEKHRCNTFSSCLTNPSINPYASTDPAGIRYFADCADVAYWLRTYFAWKKGLPFSIAVETVPRDPNDPKKDKRNETVNGNLITGRADSVAVGASFPNIAQFLSAPGNDGLILDSVSSGTYRTPIIPQPNEPLSDFYPIAIIRGSIHPGTIVYTADGHVATVYKIESDGNIATLNGSPADGSTSPTPLAVRDYNDTFKRSRQEHGSIFKNFRPLELVGAQPDSRGNLIGGQIVFKPNSQIPDASVEQANLHFDTPAQYFMFVRKRMAAGALKLDVLTEFNRSLKNVCDIVQGRVDFVNQAIAKGIDAKQIAVLPENIYSSQDDWENYSTPSRDVNIRVLFKNTRDDLRTSVRGLLAGNSLYTYSGKNLAQDLYDVYKAKAQSCSITYTTRGGVAKTLNLEDVRQRMFKISFDPYQCSDYRWGDAAAGQQECAEDVRWYNAEQFLRNQTAKDTSVNTAMTIDQLEAANQQLNKPLNWDSDILGYIDLVAHAKGVTIRKY